MGFPSRQTISSPQIKTPKLILNEENMLEQHGFPSRTFIEGSEDTVMTEPKPETVVVLDTGAVPPEEEDMSFTPPPPIYPIRVEPVESVDDTDKYDKAELENMLNSCISTLEAVDQVDEVLEESNTPLSSEDEVDATPLIPEDESNSSKRGRKPDPEFAHLRDIPVEEIIYRVFTLNELTSLPSPMLVKILQKRRTTFIKTNGKDTWNSESTYNMGDNKETLIKKLLMSNPIK